MARLVQERPTHNYPYQERKQEGRKKKGNRELVWSQTFPLQYSKPESRNNGYIVEKEKCKLIILYQICS